MSGSPKMTNRFPLPVFFRIAGHVQVGVHARLEDGNAPELPELRRVGFVVERAGDQHVEADVRCLAGSRDQIRSRDGTKLGTDEDRRAFLGAGLVPAFDVAPFRADEISRPGGDGGERDPVLLVRLLDAGSPEVLHDDAREVLRLPVSESHLRHVVDEFVVLVDVRGRGAARCSPP